MMPVNAPAASRIAAIITRRLGVRVDAGALQLGAR